MTPKTSTTPAGPIENGISFDVEEYFHALNLRPVAPEAAWDGMQRRTATTTRELADQLAAHGVKSTFFFLGWVAARDRALVKAIHAAGHEIGSHGVSHRMADELGADAFRDEARSSKALLEDITGAPVHGFRASTFSIGPRTPFALEVLVEEGYRWDSSVFPVRHDRYGDPTFSRVPVVVRTPAGPIVELPLLTWRVLGQNVPAAGGGYLRLLPVAIVEKALRAMNADGAPGVLYLHPWEFDPGQPRLLRGGLGAWRHYSGLRGTRAKLERLLGKFRFGPLGPIAEAARTSARMV
ncbi:MAG: DUF3473 domain-containing protein [Planctomycetes bacterium]|nr:DUF3473 domain-containing protein [Planctomycetota bacterium]